MSDVAAADKAQAPARRFGALVAVMVVLCACVCAVSAWTLFFRDGIGVLQTSLRLQSSGVTTTGTVVETEEYEGSHPYSSHTYKLFVEYEVDGAAYTIKSQVFYPTQDHSWVGESMPVIYDPANPASAQIDTFDERWFTPITNVMP